MRHHPLVTDNPVLLREARQLRRTWWGWALLIILLWLPLSLLSRNLASATSTSLVWWHAIAAQSLQIMLRPDLVIAFLFVARSASDSQWIAIRPELVLTLLRPLQLVAGKALVPIALLAALNIAGSYLFYRDILHDPQYMVVIPTEDPSGHATPQTPAAVGPSPSHDPFSVLSSDAWTSPGAALGDVWIPAPLPTTPTLVLAPRRAPLPASPPPGFQISLAIPVALLGMIEDVLYCVLVVMIALREYLFRTDSLMSTARATCRVLLVGTYLVAAGWIHLLILFLLPGGWLGAFLGLPIAAAFLADNAVWFALVLPFEAWVIRSNYRVVCRQMEGWMAEEAN